MGLEQPCQQVIAGAGASPKYLQPNKSAGAFLVAYACPRLWRSLPGSRFRLRAMRSDQVARPDQYHPDRPTSCAVDTVAARTATAESEPASDQQAN
jgi:hypothetical protein